MKVAFSKPTRDAGEQRQLFGAFRAAGYEGLQASRDYLRGTLGIS